MSEFLIHSSGSITCCEPVQSGGAALIPQSVDRYPTSLADSIVAVIVSRTNRSIRQLDVIITAESAVISGVAPSWYVLQLALTAGMEALREFESLKLTSLIEVDAYNNACL